MENQIRDDISFNDKSSGRMQNSDISSISGKKYENNNFENINPYFNQNIGDISSNLSDAINSYNNQEKEVRFMIVNNPLLELYKSKDAIHIMFLLKLIIIMKYLNIYSKVKN